MISKASSRVVTSLALAALLTSAGCGIMSPVQTDVDYRASDGINLALDDELDVRGLVVVGSDTANEPGRVVGQVINRSSEDVTVDFSAGGGDTVSATVPAGGSTNLGDDDLTLPSIPAKAGDLLPVTISTSGSGDNIAQVPVLLPDRYYTDYAPTK